MHTAHDPASRLRQTLNPLLTTSLGVHHHNSLHTPHSAISISSPHTFSTSVTPPSSIQRYNPQEWAPSPAVGPERTHQFPPQPSFRDSQGSAPAPPPPYSPPRSQRPVSGVFESPPANTSAARIPASNVHRPSPEPVNQQSFPPPPGANGRCASRERRFGLPSLSRRRERDQPEAITPPEAHPPTSLSRPQTLMVQIPQSAQRIENAPNAPPNSRRAASASAVDTPISARSRSTSQSRWEPGMPLPPPPPGPPPSSQARSMSLNRTSDPIVSPPTRRRPPEGISALGPVPPTPADWMDEERQNRGKSPNQPDLTIDTSNVSSSSSYPPTESASGSSSGGGLNRTGAVRGEKTLRERRNESRTRHQHGESSSQAEPLSDIFVPQGSNLSRRFSVHKGTPRSGGKMVLEGRHGDDHNADSKVSTPRPSAGLYPETPTPPFSPTPQKVYPVVEHGHPLAPKALPTPPPQSRSASSSSQMRPEMFSSMSSLASAPLSAQHMTKQIAIGQTPEQFSCGSIERFRLFAEKEARAKTDADRVKLFADFVVNESRVRRERYSSAIGAMGSEIFDLTRDLFRPMNPRRDSSVSQWSEWTPQISETKSQRSSLNSGFHEHVQSNSAPASANLPASPMSGTQGNNNWQSQYMPSLSPILSMSISEALDESSSRGRPASRWWESESAGDSTRIERTKRESKYMSVPKEAREALQYEDALHSGDSRAGPSKRYSANEYPPEKVGWHSPDNLTTPQPPFRNSLLSMASSAPNTPSPFQLDVSRLVTLPPPYPRHHPAVNNNHPDLSSTRIQVRALTDMTELQTTKERFIVESQKAHEEAKQAALAREKSLRMNLQQEISSGNMSYAEAAAIEADTRETEKAQAKDMGRKDFEQFQNVVVMPLNDLLTSRIMQASSLFEELKSQLFVETQAPNPNMPQEEGDEQPEVLEKLTLLKWIFEAREMLYREIYDLLSDRNERYKEVVVTPYRLSGNTEKQRTAEQFFADDASKRRATFATEVLQRTCEFRDVIEENCVRGVDMQLNAFWDIAPPLKRLLDKIPLALDGSFRIQIPPAEFDENPAYINHPLQYLYSLLLHAEKSTYQFIESQTNLLCLLHEVKESVMGARAKVSEAEGRDARSVEDQSKGEREQLTDDLKEKVRVVQDQWDGALGDGMRGVKERVGEWLLSTGGWDESLEDNGVGGA